MLNKKRLDVMLFERGLTQSREKARTVIMAGNVYVDNQKADKPGTLFKDDVKIEVRSPRINYVSRGGLKLEKAIKAFKIELNGKVAMDIVAKHIPADKNGVRIAELDEMSYRKTLWAHQPLTDFWRVGRGYAKKLEEHGMFTMGDVALCSERNPTLHYR